MQNKKLIVILVVSIVVIITAVYLISPDKFSVLRDLSRTIGLEKETPKIIEEKLVIPETQKIIGNEGKIVSQGPVDVSLVPKAEGEKVVVSKAVLTVKGSYNLAKQEAGKWSSDAKLVFVKSLGAITLEGKSSQWQIVFMSKTKTGKGYEIIVQEDQVVSQKEIPSKIIGADLPKNWYDSDGAIKSLQTLPQFLDATVSSIVFSYDTDSKKWMYALSTSRGATAMTVE